MTIKTTNVGLVKAIHVGTTPPVNTDMLWRDTNFSIHKYYNTSNSTWESLINSVLIDNVTIKRDINDKLYVDETALATFVLSDKSVTLQKMADVASSTVFYRKTAGSGSPEIQTLAQLKTDLGLAGNNSGDQDLSVYVLKVTTINLKPLTGNITLTPTDIGSPAGSGTSTNTNTGDETQGTILAKLEIAGISGENTGDQDASEVSIIDSDELFVSENVEDALKETLLKAESNSLFSITLSAGSNVANKIIGATLPDGWSLDVGSTDVDLLIIHNLDRRGVIMTLFYVNGSEEIMLIGTQAYNGIRTTQNTITINSVATGITSRAVKIYIRFV